MERQRVTSSNIASIGYDPASSVLEVEFVNGSIYQYRSVPQYIHDALMTASSHGSYLNREIKGKYSYLQIR